MQVSPDPLLLNLNPGWSALISAANFLGPSVLPSSAAASTAARRQSWCVSIAGGWLPSMSDFARSQEGPGGSDRRGARR